MHVIKQGTLKSYAEEKRFATARGELELWFQIAVKADWKNLLDVQKDYPKAEAVRVKDHNYTVFNICGNKFRLIVQIRYSDDSPERDGTIFIKDFLTHPEYDTDNWKKILEKAQIARTNFLKQRRRT